MQAKVPKFIDIEDKVAFGMTWRQFAYLGGSLTAAFISLSVFRGMLGFPIALILVIVGTSLAFAKPSGRSFGTLLLAVFRYNYNPRRYFWQKERSRVQIAQTGKQAPDTATSARPEDIAAKLREVSRALDMKHAVTRQKNYYEERDR